MNWLNPADSQLEFLKHIAPARTFGFLQEIEALRARGLALGGSLDNALIIDGEKFLNKGGQRIENELASHKLLDAVGDFALAGKPIIGKIDLKGSGHALHLSALRAALENGCLQPGFLMADGKILAACSNK
jgi:UDP-3-O-[3-hydroxymyristoyl] N-acetylglucosamine deacetylase